MPDESQPLTTLEVGSAGTVSEIKVPPESRGRLLEMGLLVGTSVELVRFAPLGDPVEIKVRGYHLTLRKNEAEQIWVKRPLSAAPPNPRSITEDELRRTGK
jgi:ferrous iron transport protein A